MTNKYSKRHYACLVLLLGIFLLLPSSVPAYGADNVANPSLHPAVISAGTDHLGKKIVLEFDRAMADPVGKQDQFTVIVNGVEKTVSRVALGSNPRQILLSMASKTSKSTGTIALTYTGGGVAAADGALLESFSNLEITNNALVGRLADFEPTATEISYDASVPVLKYRFDDLLDYDNIKLTIYFANGFFRTFETNLANNVKFYEKNTGAPVNLPNVVTVGMLDTGSLPTHTWTDGSKRGYMEITDWYFWQIQGRSPLGLNLKSKALQPSTTYVIEIGPDFEFNNGLKLGTTCSFEFTTRGKDSPVVTTPSNIAKPISISPAAEQKTNSGGPGDAVKCSDIKGHWAEAGIAQLVKAGIMNGRPDNTFKPDDKITRAEFCTTLVKALKLTGQAGSSFADTGEHWAKDYIAIAAANGIVHGTNGNNFAPDAPVTREQMAMMLCLAKRMSAVDGGQDFNDAAQFSYWAREAVNTVSAKKLMSGYPDNTFRPRGLASRAEAAAVINKLMQE